MEEVLVLIKPDGTQRVLAGNILNQFMSDGVELAGLKLVKPSKKLAQDHYKFLKGKFFYKQIVDYISGVFHQGEPVVAMVFRGKDAVKKCRLIAGATNPEEADPKSIRGKYGRITTKGLYENVVHVSSSVEEAKREIKLWFKQAELIKK